MSAIDLKKFRKVHALMTGGATDGERAAAKARAEAMAMKAGMTLQEAVSSLDTPPAAKPVNIFEGFDDWMEEKEPGYKAKRAQERAARNSREDQRRAEVLAQYGSEAALFARTAWEAALDAAIAPLATWDHWTDSDGVKHRFTDTLDGKRPKIGFWHLDDITPAIREAVMTAYMWPSNLDTALQEVKAWDRLRWDRGLFGGEWNHYAEVECRILLLEHELDTGRPAASWEDVQARFDWKRYEFERQWIDPTERCDPFLDRLEADIAALAQLVQPVQSGRRTNAGKRADVLSMLDAHPDLSDREIARRVGVSPQTVNSWRHRRSHGTDPRPVSPRSPTC